MGQRRSLSIFCFIFSRRTLPRLGHQTVICRHLPPFAAIWRRHEARHFKTDALWFSVRVGCFGAIVLTV